EGELLVSRDCPHQVSVNEHGTEFVVDLGGGHKTGFFCDQRDNRRRLSAWHRGQSLLDLCCYTGGFTISAALTHPESTITGVDLDEQAIETARKNASRNRVRPRL